MNINTICIDFWRTYM